MIRLEQGGRGVFGLGLDFGNPDFVAYARSYGAKGSRVGNAREFSTVLEAAFQQGGVHLVVAPIDYSENMRVLVNELHFRRREPPQAAPQDWCPAFHRSG